MATRSERARADAQRKNAAKKRVTRPSNSKPGVAPRNRSRAKKRVEAKATYALDATTGARHSRRSTRKSANRARTDTSFELTQAREAESPEARFRVARAHATRTRGKSKGA
jgi:hypothetical protein